jgi:hypothetical protein
VEDFALPRGKGDHIRAVLFAFQPQKPSVKLL